MSIFMQPAGRGSHAVSLLLGSIEFAQCGANPVRILPRPRSRVETIEFRKALWSAAGKCTELFQIVRNGLR